MASYRIIACILFGFIYCDVCIAMNYSLESKIRTRLEAFYRNVGLVEYAESGDIKYSRTYHYLNPEFITLVDTPDEKGKNYLACKLSRPALESALKLKPYLPLTESIILLSKSNYAVNPTNGDILRLYGEIYPDKPAPEKQAGGDYLIHKGDRELMSLLLRLDNLQGTLVMSFGEIVQEIANTRDFIFIPFVEAMDVINNKEKSREIIPDIMAFIIEQRRCETRYYFVDYVTGFPGKLPW